MEGRVIQRNVEILLQPADAVKHRVAVGVERIAGLFQRATANQVIVERFAVLRVLFPVMGGQAAQFYGDQTAAPLQIFQQQRYAELRRRADPFPVKTLIPHQLQRFPRGGVKLGQVEKLVQRLGDEDLKVEFLRQRKCYRKTRRMKQSFGLYFFPGKGVRVMACKYLDFQDRKKIAKMYQEEARVLDIAYKIGCHPATIYEELRRGDTGKLDKNQRPEYDPRLAQRTFQEAIRRRGNRRTTTTAESGQ